MYVSPAQAFLPKKPSTSLPSSSSRKFEDHKAACAGCQNLVPSLFQCRHMQIIGNSRSLFNTAAGGDESTVGAPQKSTPLQDRSNRQQSANSKPSASKATPQLDGQLGGQEGRRKPRFASINLPPSDALSGCDEKGEVHSYEDAVKQFNKGMTAFKQALEVSKPASCLAFRFLVRVNFIEPETERVKKEQGQTRSHRLSPASDPCWSLLGLRSGIMVLSPWHLPGAKKVRWLFSRPSFQSGS